MTLQKKLSRLNKWVRRAFRRRLANEHAGTWQAGQLYLMAHLSPACWLGFQGAFQWGAGTGRPAVEATGPAGTAATGHL